MSLPEPPLADWDVTIERAQHEPHVEEKLIQTVSLLGSAAQRCRLRGDADRARELSERLAYVHELLDQYRPA